MEAKDGSFGFDFTGVYTNIKGKKVIEYNLDDGRSVRIDFNQMEEKTQITEVFEAEPTNSIEQQKNGWQAILNNFKRVCEE
jgi:hypothetical protein